MKSLRKFSHINASTLDEAVSVLRRFGGKAWVMAGGTDVLVRCGLKFYVITRKYW